MKLCVSKRLLYFNIIHWKKADWFPEIFRYLRFNKMTFLIAWKLERGGGDLIWYLHIQLPAVIVKLLNLVVKMTSDLFVWLNQTWHLIPRISLFLFLKASAKNMFPKYQNIHSMISISMISFPVFSGESFVEAFYTIKKIK